MVLEILYEKKEDWPLTLDLGFLSKYCKGTSIQQEPEFNTSKKKKPVESLLSGSMICICDILYFASNYINTLETLGQKNTKSECDFSEMPSEVSSEVSQCKW